MRGTCAGRAVGGLLLTAATVPPDATENLTRLGFAPDLTREDALMLRDAFATPVEHQ